MGFATGRGTRCRHSTSMEWDEVERKQRRTGVRYSTGRGSPIKHSSGALLKNKKGTQKIYTDEDLEFKETTKGGKGINKRDTRA